MKQLTQELKEVDGVKAIERHGDVLKLKLFSKEVPRKELYRIPGDLGKTSQKIRHILENSEAITGYEITAKPEKKYRDKAFKNSEVSDRESKGYSRDFYEVSVRE